MLTWCQLFWYAHQVLEAPHGWWVHLYLGPLTAGLRRHTVVAAPDSETPNGHVPD